MTGGGPVQELEQQRPWPPGAGESRRPWSRTGRLEMNHPSESPYFHNNTTGINVGQRITFNGGRDETTTTTATHSHNHMTTSNLVKSSSAAKTFDNFQHNPFNSKQSEEANYFQRAKTNNDNFCDFNSSTSIRPETPNEIRSLANLNKHNGVCEREDFNLDEDDEDDDESLSEPLSAVASAEEYAAKIFKLQQACLTPLKEDLADWLNKIMDLSSITSENFMHKLDNGVIICRLAKIISMWCEQQFSNQQLINSSHQELTGIPQYPVISEKHHQNPPIITQPSGEYSRTSTATIVTQAQNYPQKLSTSTSNVYSHLNKNNPTSNVESYDNLKGTSTATTPLTPVLRPQPRARVFTSHGGQLKSTSLSTNCIASLSSANSLSYLSSTNPFLDNLIKMIQTKIWEDAKCRTFYARDNVSNFLRWTRGFGVNQSVLFESDDLVLHANTRQVVLCLLDVARIACVKHGFTEAPGLVKFEQEIDRELAAEREAAEKGGRDDAQFSHSVASSGGRFASQNNNHTTRRLSSRDESATDELILRYCRHKEEEAARKKAAAEVLKEEENESSQERDVAMFEPDSLAGGSPDDKDSGTSTTKSPTGDPHSRNNHIGYDYRVDSLDSGEGRTESASTSHSRTPVNSLPQTKTQSAIPVPVKQQQQQRQRSQSNSSLSRASSITTSELSSSRSSLLSNQDSCATGNKRHTASSDLDGKVMRIAKSYYGKGAKRDVTRLSEGKYKIADRIVFVRLLKGHRVMVRIGGGWDTLENFLFRHKSDPSQVIDVDNLLPLETKMTFEKSSSSHANSSANGLHKQNSRLPYYQQQKSSSASSTNLSTSIDLSVVSPAMSSIEGRITTAASSASISQAICTPVRRINNIPPSRQESMPESSSATTNTSHQTPYLLIHRGNNRQQRQNSFPSKHPVIPHRANSIQASLPSKIQSKNAPLRKLSGAHIGNRPLGNSRTPNASSTNLYPATLTTNRIAQSASSSKPFNNNSSRLLNGSPNNLLNGTNHNGGNHQDRLNQKQEAFRKLGRSSDSLQQVSYLRTPRNYGNLTTTSNNGSRNNAINNGPPKLTPKVSAKEAKA